MAQILATYTGTIDISISKNAKINFSGFTTQTLKECFEATIKGLGLDPSNFCIRGVVVSSGYPNSILEKIVFQKGTQALSPEWELTQKGFNNARTSDDTSVYIKAI